jgi:hypothetical protein
MRNKTLKNSIIIIALIVLHSEIKAQEIKPKKDNRLYTSIDLTDIWATRKFSLRFLY